MPWPGPAHGPLPPACLQPSELQAQLRVTNGGPQAARGARGRAASAGKVPDPSRQTRSHRFPGSRAAAGPWAPACTVRPGPPALRQGQPPPVNSRGRRGPGGRNPPSAPDILDGGQDASFHVSEKNVTFTQPTLPFQVEKRPGLVSEKSEQPGRFPGLSLWAPFTCSRPPRLALALGPRSCPWGSCPAPSTLARPRQLPFTDTRGAPAALCCGSWELQASPGRAEGTGAPEWSPPPEPQATSVEGRGVRGAEVSRALPHLLTECKGRVSYGEDRATGGGRPAPEWHWAAARAGDPACSARQLGRVLTAPPQLRGSPPAQSPELRSSAAPFTGAGVASSGTGQDTEGDQRCYRI